MTTGVKQGFDEANRLCWSAPSGTGICDIRPSGATRYGYDLKGNWTSVTPPSGPATTLTCDQANRHTAYGTTSTYAGRQPAHVQDGERHHHRLRLDLAEDLPLPLLEGATAYASGRGALPLEQVSGSTVRYYHHDQLGSTRALTDGTGAVVATYTYNAHGKLTASTGTVTNPFGYAGQYTDAESGLIYMRARYYDPATGSCSHETLSSLERSVHTVMRRRTLSTDPTPSALYRRRGGPTAQNRRAAASAFT